MDNIGGTISLQNELINILNSSSMPSNSSPQLNSNSIIEGSLSNTNSFINGGQTIEDMIDTVLQKPQSIIANSNQAQPATTSPNMTGGDISQSENKIESQNPEQSLYTNQQHDDVFDQIFANSNPQNLTDFNPNDIPNGELYSNNSDSTTESDIDNITDESSDFDSNQIDDSDIDSDSDELNDNQDCYKYIKIINELKEIQTSNNSLSLKGAGKINKRVRIINAFPYIIKSTTS